MKTVYVVRRPFKSRGRFYAVGEVLPSLEGIKLPKIKQNEGKLLPLREDKSLPGTVAYLEQKLGVNIRENVMAALGGPKASKERKTSSEARSEPKASKERKSSSKAQSEPKPKSSATTPRKRQPRQK